jgi:hypothetical protein
MARSFFRFLTPLAAAAILAASPLSAQSGLTLPPDGNNEFGSVTQGIGLVRVTIQYNSPHVHSPAGEDRHGKIWGGLVPYGMASLGFGTCGDQCPWRGGANENTTFTTSHDVKVQGQALPAGTYGVHFIPGPEEWTIVFSKNNSSWGSFFYDAKEDALRVKARPEKSEYREWLTYEFTERKPDRATAALEWEDLQLPFTIAVDDIAGIYVDNLRRELRSSPGFSWKNWTAAARYCLENKKNLEEAMIWADKGAHLLGIGQENLTSLGTLSEIQAANGQAEEARKTLDRGLNLPSTTPLEIYQYGRSLQAQKKNEEAMKIFQLNAKRFPSAWPVHLGLARGHAALGHKKEALAEAHLAVKQAPDENIRKNAEALIQQIEGS